MSQPIDSLPQSVRRALFWCAYVFFLVLAVFVILAPRAWLTYLHVWLWSWLLLIPPVCWFFEYLRTLYRGGE